MGSNPRWAAAATLLPHGRASACQLMARRSCRDLPSAPATMAAMVHRARRASRIVRPNSGNRPPTGRPRLSLRANSPRLCLLPPRSTAPVQSTPTPPRRIGATSRCRLRLFHGIAGASRRLLSAVRTASPADGAKWRMLATRRLRQKLHRLLMEAERDAQRPTSRAQLAAAEVARTRAGVLIGSDPGPPPHFPAFIYEPENNSMSPDICDSNCALRFHRRRQVEFREAVSIAFEPARARRRTREPRRAPAPRDEQHDARPAAPDISGATWRRRAHPRSRTAVATVANPSLAEASAPRCCPGIAQV